MDHFWKGDYEKMRLVKEVETEPNFHDNLEIEGKIYSGCACNFENKVMGVEEISLVDDPGEQNEDEFTCPYCLHVDHDAFELNDSGTIDCSNCGSEIEYERVVEVSYMVMPVKKNNPIKI